MTDPTTKSMSNETELDQAFDKFLAELPNNRTLRQQFWMAFKAGADHVLGKIRGELGKNDG